MKKFTTHINENSSDTKSKILVIVDVQEEFSKFIPNGFVNNLIEYSKQFEFVYQIWDSNDANKASYKFANQKGIMIKKFGTKFSDELIETIKKLDKKYPEAVEGFKVKLVDIDKDDTNGSVEEIQADVQGNTTVEDDKTDAYVVRVNNKHRWFFVTTKLSKFFKSLSGKNVIIVGGAYTECEYDVYIAMKSFRVNIKEDKRYIYSAKNNNQQVHDPKTQSQLI